MRAIYRQHAWLMSAFIVGVAVVGTIMSYLDSGDLRYFNAVMLTITWGAWMSEYIDSRPTLYRRQRRLRLAFAFFLFSGMYGSLEAALDPQGEPLLRVLLVAISGGAVLTSILFRPADDYGIPEDHIFPWERWIFGSRQR